MHFNLGNFEWAEAHASFKYDADDMTSEEVSKQLDEMILFEVDRARRMTAIPEEDNDTCVYKYQDMMEG